MNQENKNTEGLETQLLLNWIDDEEVKSQLSIKLNKSIKLRREGFTQQEVSE